LTAFLNATSADCTPSSSHPTSSSTAPVVSPLLRVFGRQRNDDDAKICSWLAGVEDGLDIAPILRSGQRSRVISLHAGTLNKSSNAQASVRDATETDTRSVSARSGHTAPSGTSKPGSSLVMSCAGTSAQAKPPFLTSSTVMTTPRSIESELQSIATSQVLLPSDSLSGPNPGCHVRDDGPSVHRGYPEPSRARSVSSTRSSGPDRLTPSPVTTSSSSSESGPHPVSLSAVPVDLQLPPTSRSARSTSAPRSGMVYSTATSGRNSPAGSASLVPTNTSRQSTVSVIINRSYSVCHRPTYPDARVLGSQNRDPTRTDVNLFDDIVTLLHPSAPFHAPALGFHRLARDRPRRPLVLVGNDRPLGGPAGQGDVFSEMLRLTR